MKFKTVEDIQEAFELLLDEVKKLKASVQKLESEQEKKATVKEDSGLDDLFN